VRSAAWLSPATSTTGSTGCTSRATLRAQHRTGGRIVAGHLRRPAFAGCPALVGSDCAGFGTVSASAATCCCAANDLACVRVRLGRIELGRKRTAQGEDVDAVDVLIEGLARIEFRDPLRFPPQPETGPRLRAHEARAVRRRRCACCVLSAASHSCCACVGVAAVGCTSRPSGTVVVCLALAEARSTAFRPANGRTTASRNLQLQLRAGVRLLERVEHTVTGTPRAW